MDKSRLRIETHRSGIFTFSIGLAFEKLETLRLRVEDAYANFCAIPLNLEIFDALEKNTWLTSIYGSNTIEEGLLSKPQVEEVLLHHLNQWPKEQARRVLNLKNAYSYAKNRSLSVSLEQPLLLEEKDIKEVHRLVTEHLKHTRNQPGIYRNNLKGFPTMVGRADWGGVYQPPKCLADINMLMKAFMQWINNEAVLKLPPLYRAPLAHLYFEWIHPFWDGNGRVGRIIEAMLLQPSYGDVPMAIAEYYWKNLSDYFTLFNVCRKKSEKKMPYPNTDFVHFFLEGMLETFRQSQECANVYLRELSFMKHVSDLVVAGKINLRQQAVLEFLFKIKDPITKKILSLEVWYNALYHDYHAKTKERDLKQLEALRLISLENNQVQLVDLWAYRLLTKIRE